MNALSETLLWTWLLAPTSLLPSHKDCEAEYLTQHRMFLRVCEHWRKLEAERPFNDKEVLSVKLWVNEILREGDRWVGAMSIHDPQLDLGDVHPPSRLETLLRVFRTKR